MNTHTLQSELLLIFSDVLNTQVNLKDNFEDIGGESIEMQDIVGKINRIYQLKIKVRDLIKLRYIDSMIEQIISQLQEK